MNRAIVSSLILAVLAPFAVGAQEAAQQSAAVVPPAPASQTVGMTEEEKADLNRRLRRFQAVLQSAVENGGSRLADRAQKVVNGVVDLAMNGTPQINPVFIPGVGIHFDVQVPDILASSLAMWSYIYKRQLATPVANNAAGDKVTANGVVRPDPMVPVVPDFEPDKEYATFVRQELIDVMIESWSVLPLKAEDKLVVSARVPAQVQ